MNKTPKMFYLIFALALIMIGVLGFGFIYDAYLKPVDCASFSADSCPGQCAICPTCPTCQDLLCQDVKTCKANGTYDKQFEQIRNKEGYVSLSDKVSQIYEPALRKFDAYDRFEIVECDQALCVKILLNKDSAELKNSMPGSIDGMKVTYEVVTGGSSAKKCGIQNCHGLDISCGSNVPDVCTEIYMMGDGCRKFAKCEFVEGSCRQVSVAEFDACKACVKKCEKDFLTDSVKMFECEGVCIK
jgi:hypothetical protein